MFEKFEFTKDWKDPTAFPTIETDEAQVRADMQLLHDESKAAIHALIEALADKSACLHIGATDKDGSKKSLYDLLSSLLRDEHSHKDLDELERLILAFTGLTPTNTVKNDSKLIPTAKAVYDQISSAGLGDMLRSVYDPAGKATDVFKYTDDAAAKKADAQHTHNAADITTGTLPLSRGGTGSSVDLTEAPNNAIIHKLENDSYHQLSHTPTKAGAFFAQAENGEARFGVLPVALGGTDSTNPTNARAKLGAAAEVHQHAAGDITSGSLSLARGGTGEKQTVSNAPINAIVKKAGDGGSYLNSVATENGAFYATATNGEPRFGVLPLAQGGTGTDLSGFPAGSIIAKGAAGDYLSYWTMLPVSKGGTGATTQEEALKNLNAVSKAGGTMTGDLTIQRAGYPSLRLRDAEGKNCGTLQANAETKRLTQYVYPTDSSEVAEGYQWPAADTGLTGSKYYSVLTSKNPVTIAQGGTGAKNAEDARTALGAAAEEHQHAAGDITSGIFPISRGGTGTTFSNAPQGAVIAKGSSGLSYWTYVPVAQGGTGAGTKAAARKNLGIRSGTSLPSDGEDGDIFFLIKG